MIQKFWNRFISESKIENAVLKGSICFGDSRESAESACEAILSGRKTLMTYPENGYRTAMKGRPSAGDLNIIVNWAGEPVCVIETVCVNRMLFRDLGAKLAEKDLPGVENWQEIKETEFKRELEELSMEFDDQMPVIAEEFRKIWPETV